MLLLSSVFPPHCLPPGKLGNQMDTRVCIIHPGHKCHHDDPALVSVVGTEARSKSGVGLGGLGMQ